MGRGALAAFGRAVPVAVLAALCLSGAARAGVGIARSDPADGAVLTEVPSQVRVEFTGAVIARMSTVTVQDARGRVLRGTRQRSEGERVLVVDLPPLRVEGAQTVFYVRARVVGADLEVSEPRFRFFVAGAPGAGGGERAGGSRVGAVLAGAVAVAVAAVVAWLVRRKAV